jgi:hypothetical protein
MGRLHVEIGLMSSSEERLKILQMVQNGRITAEEGIKLMESLERQDVVPTPPGVPSAPGPAGIPGHKSQRWVRVCVTDVRTGKMRVNVRLPVSLINAGMKMGARFGPEVEGMDLGQLKQIVNSGETGRVFDVYDDEDGEHVEVFIE